MSVKIANYNDKLDFPSHISLKARDFIMSCLRKSPFHRKNITKLLNHPYITSQQDRMEKSFDDVSELHFDERPRSSREYRRPSSRRSYKGIGNNNELTPVRAPNDIVTAEKNANDNLLNVLKKIEKQRKDGPHAQMHLDVDPGNQRAKSHGVGDRFTQRPSRNEYNMLKKSPEIDFLDEGSSKPQRQFITNNISSRHDHNVVRMKVPQQTDSYSNYQTGNARFRSSRSNRNESFSDNQSSSNLFN